LLLAMTGRWRYRNARSFQWNVFHTEFLENRSVSVCNIYIHNLIRRWKKRHVYVITGALKAGQLQN
jgi:hypothetical protein